MHLRCTRSRGTDACLCRGRTGTVLFSTTREAAKAIQLFNDTFLLGRKIEVRPDQRV